MQLSHGKLTDLDGIGPKLAEQLQRLAIQCPRDLLFHLPRAYDDRTQLRPLSHLRFGQRALVQGEIIDVDIQRGRRQSLLCTIAQGSQFLTIRLFHFNYRQHQQMEVGKILRAFGEVRFSQDHREMVHPEYRVFESGHEPPLEKSLRPLYPTTEGLSQNRLYKIIEQVLSCCDEQSLPELLPSALAKDLMSLNAALQIIHRPAPGVNIEQLQAGRHPAQQRLAFEELLAHRLSLRMIRSQEMIKQAPRLAADQQLTPRLLKQLPFRLTGAQQRVVQEISTDLNSGKAMLRLLQGDVGSGKTLVAQLAALQAVSNHMQAAVMAPTEILAEQHYQHFCATLEPLGVKVVWLASKMKGRDKKQTLAALADGHGQIAIGTQALFQDGVLFKKLALVIIDEQHRFGVEQRRALQQKGLASGEQTHQLVMTATPIPRTLAMTAYADLDISIIDQLPPGRTPVKTAVLPDTRRADVIDRVRQACAHGRQAYWVCTLIEESEVLTCQAAEETARYLLEELKPLRVGLVHGRMKPAEKAQVMDDFKQHQLDVLVATTVIEVGVNVPNASLMIIENPERLGLSQIHQLRGRVGRGSTVSYCVLMYQSPLSKNAQARLHIIRQSNDGFALAEEDLKLRGPGELLGTRQTGALGFRIADVLRDQALLPQVQQVAAHIIQNQPDLVQPLMQRWFGDVAAYRRV